MNIKSKKILITGAAGFLGSHLSEKFVSLGYNVTGVDNMSSGYEDNISKKIKFVNLDCCNVDRMKDIMKEVDVVYHCAAAAH